MELAKFITGLVAPGGGDTQRDRERVFGLLHRLVRTAIAYGMASAPDGQSGRDAYSDQASTQFAKLVMALQIYLSAHPELEMKRGGFPISKKFAGNIQADVLDAMGLPPDAKEPSVNQIVDALRAVRSRSLSR